MVIARQEWFNQRNKPFYSYGMTWQGWIYFMALLMMLFTGIMLHQNMIISLIAIGAYLFLIMDMIIASYKSMDERGKMHYSTAMRNMAWGMIITIITASIIIDYANIENGTTVLIGSAGLVGGLIAFITRYKLEKEN